MNLNIKENISEIIKGLSTLEKKQLPRLAKETTNNIAFETMYSIRKEVTHKFKGKSMSNAIRLRKATNDKPFAEIYVDDYFRWKENALTTLGLGGDRARKSMERMLIRAGYMKSYEILTPVGKANGGVYTKIASQLQLFYKSGFDANETIRSRKKNNAKRGDKARFFVVTSGKVAIVNNLGKIKKRKTGLAPGVYAALYSGTNDEMSRAGKHVRILKIAKKPNYKKTFDMEKILMKVYERRGDELFRKAFKYVFK